jgi:hypothetical protein
MEPFMTRLTDALSCLADIHAHLAKGEVYRGIESRPVLWSGLIGITAAFAQPVICPLVDARLFVLYWLLVAGLAAMVGISGAVLKYFLEDDSVSRRRAHIVAGQFAPCVAAGFFLPLALLNVLDQTVGLLPGLWAMLYALGLFAARPYLPRHIGWVALYFLLAGTLLVTLLNREEVPSPWHVAGVFSLGQMALAYVLHRNTLRETTLG